MSTETEQTTAVSWSWLKSISRDLYAQDEKPLLGYPPPFPWEKLSESLATTFGLEDCSLTADEIAWKEQKEILKGLPEPRVCVQMQASNIEGVLAFFLSRQDIVWLMSKALHLPTTLLQEQPEEMAEAFHQFLSLQSLFLINQLDFDKRLSLKIVSYDSELSPEVFQGALCEDITIQIGKEKISGRLVLSNAFRKGWCQLFAKPQKYISRLEEIPVTVHVEAGRTHLPLQELLEVRTGDYLLLDQAHFSPDDEKSRLLLTINGKPLFRAKLKTGSLKILETPLHSEVYDPMIDKIRPPAPIGQPDYHAPSQPLEEEKNPFEDEEENPFEDEEEDEFEEQQEEELEVEAVPSDIKKTVASKTPGTATSPLTAENIPITVTIELAQMEMSAQKLLELQPGNLIDLDLAPDHPVHLVVSGKIIGKGEILKIGETIGVRVLEIGI